MSLFIEVLYSSDFLPAIEYLRVGIFWTIITLCSNQIDMILVAKYNTKIFILISVVLRIVQLLLCILLYDAFGLMGLGISYAILGVLHMLVMVIVVGRLYDIYLSKECIRVALTVLFMSIIATLANLIDNDLIKYTIEVILILSALLYSNYQSKNKLNLDFIQILKSKLNKK